VFGLGGRFIQFWMGLDDDPIADGDVAQSQDSMASQLSGIEGTRKFRHHFQQQMLTKYDRRRSSWFLAQRDLSLMH
jgi:hypothetical protein